jgi:hypothetical protein
MKKDDPQLVLKHCANYNAGYICSGIIIGKHLNQWVDTDMCDKTCLIKNGEECEYFNNFVKPII